MPVIERWTIHKRMDLMSSPGDYEDNVTIDGPDTDAAEVVRVADVECELERLRAKLDAGLAAAERAADLAERYGEAILAIRDALPDVEGVRRIVAALAT